MREVRPKQQNTTRATDCSACKSSSTAATAILAARSGGEAIGTGRDRREGNRGELVRERKQQAVPVAHGEQAVFAAATSASNGTHGVNDAAHGQPKARRDLRLSRLAAAKPGAGRAQLWTGRAVDRPVNAATAQQSPVGGVDDGVDGKRADVAFDDLDAVSHSSHSSRDRISGSSPPKRECAKHAEMALRGQRIDRVKIRRRWPQGAGNAPR